MPRTNLKLLAFDLDGTLTQHKSPLSSQCKDILLTLGKRYNLLMVGAGSCQRIYSQMQGFPISIIGNYGMQYSSVDKSTGKLILKEDISVKTDISLTISRAEKLRATLNLQRFEGNTIEIHPSGMLTFPVLGTGADISNKLSYDPLRTKRRQMYHEVALSFPEYNVYIGGASSFDIVPCPYSKLYALDRYCSRHGLSHSDIVYFGDDYGEGGNDEDIFLSDIQFEKIDDYRFFPDYAEKFL